MITPVQLTSNALHKTIRQKPSFFCHFARIVKVWDQKKFLIKQSQLKSVAQILYFLIFLKMTIFSGTL